MKEPNKFLEAALFYAQRMGWPVFPLATGTKVPLKGSKGSLDATTDEKQIRQWWETYPTANVAIRTGDTIFVVDIDVRHGGRDTFDSLELKHGKLRDTLRQMTGRRDGSFQLIYRHPPGEPIANAEKICGWDGIDLRGANGYIVAPPSIHPDSGEEYFWDTAKRSILEEEIAEADPWLIHAIRAAQNGHQEFQMPPDSQKIPWGAQKHTLFRLGCSMRQKGCGYDEIMEALWAVNQTRCERPGPRHNIEREARWICQHYAAGAPVADMPPGPAHVDAPTVTPQPLTRKHSLMTYNADCPEPTPLIDPILYPGLTILGGRPKMGKSWFALQLALAAVNQLKLAGYLAVEKRFRALYVSLEDREPQLKKRLHHLVPSPDYLEGLDLVYELAPLLAGGIAQLDQTLTEDPANILIVDSLLAAAQQAGRKNVDILQTDYNIIRALRELATKHKLALLLIAHTRKAPGDFLDMIQGTTGTTAAADAVWVLKRTPEGKATLEVTGREVPENTFGLQRAADSPAWVITGEGDAVTQSDARQDILQLLHDKCRPARGANGKLKPSPGLSPSAIAKELHKSISGVNRLLVALCKLQLVVKTGYGMYNLPGEDEPPEAYE